MEMEKKANQNQAVCSTNSYTITVKLEDNKLNVCAYSQKFAKLFRGRFTEKDFPEDIRAFGGCEGILGIIQESIEMKQEAQLSDSGQLRFLSKIQLGKLKFQKDIIFPLKQVEINEYEVMKLKIQSLEKKLDELTSEPVQAIFQIDTTSKYYNKFKICNRTVSLLPGTTKQWYPLFSKNITQRTQQYIFYLENISSMYFMIGIATEQMKKEKNVNASNSSVGIYSRGYFFASGDASEANWKPQPGSKLIMVVNLKKQTVKFVSEMKYFRATIGKGKIPETMMGRPLYAFIQFFDDRNEDQIKLN